MRTKSVEHSPWLRSCVNAKRPARHGKNLQRLQELHQILLFLFSKSQLQMLIIMLDDVAQTLEPAIVVEPALLMAPQSAQRRGPVLLGWRREDWKSSMPISSGLRAAWIHPCFTSDLAKAKRNCSLLNSCICWDSHSVRMRILCYFLSSRASCTFALWAVSLTAFMNCLAISGVETFPWRTDLNDTSRP
jgi:hypothetical protein